MPATEQTWRSTKLLHKIFAISGMIMLVSTIWLLAKDHARPWKPYQRTARSVDIKLADWRKLQFMTNDAVAEHKEVMQQLDEARQQAVEWSLVESFIEKIEASEVTADYVSEAASLKDLAEDLTAVAGTSEAEGRRDDLIGKMKSIVESVRVDEETLLGRLKFARADRDAAVAVLGLQVRDNKSAEEMAAQQVIVDGEIAAVNEWQNAYDAAKTQRAELQAIIAQVTAAEDAAHEAISKNRAGLAQLETTAAEKRSTYITWYGAIPLPGKRWLELPILDAFNSPLKIDNRWSDGLTIDYNFSKVRRFDRCTTCHQGIQKTNPGSAVDPAYDQEDLIEFVLLPPDATNATEFDAEATPEDLLAQYYGIRLAAEGLLLTNAVTVKFVQPESLAAQATALVDNEPATVSGEDVRHSLLSGGEGEEHIGVGLKLGDVIARVDGDPVGDPQKVMFRLIDAAESDTSLTLTIRRGLPSPYTSHPRLDLFVGSLSPHKMSEFACTVCHDGQGSSTSFEWASHSPNSKLQIEEWTREHGWFDNPHWIYPMYPARFAESSCLKCHHEVTELEPSEKFPDPPAPKVVHGYDLIRKYGCYGCHEINGYDGGERIGPDMRLEPNYFAAALQIQTLPGFESMSDEVKQWTSELAEHPERDGIRNRIYESLVEDAKQDEPALSARTHATIVPLFKDVENAGKIRKPGPSLRYASHKLDREFMFDWIRDPKNFRPSSRMPQFFGLWSHFEGGHDDVAAAFEPLEILGIVTYLNGRSQGFDYLDPPEGVAEASAERGKILFEERGCLACHNHNAFPDTATFREKDAIVQGPDLSGVGTKFDVKRNPNGAKWLYSWIKQPSRYHTRTVMPDLFLDPIEQPVPELPEGSEEEKPEPKPPTDPAADIVAYLLESSTNDWHAAEGTLATADEADAATLDKLVLENLKDAYSEAAATRYAKEGIPPELRDELKGAEIELLKDAEGAIDDNGKLTTDAKLLYLGRKSIAKYGCYGCHDISGFEDAKPIGTALADWGRKETNKLAFEHITHFLKEHGHSADGHGASEGGAGGHDHSEHGDDEAASHDDNNGDEGHDSDHDDLAAHDHADHDGHVDDGETQEMRDYYHHQIEGHHRSGFIYQKLAEPRSYDYHKTENKKYNERLRMPKFPFTAQEREAVITFVLGLVADPPSEQYVYQPDERQKAITEGRQVLDKFNCAGCHMLEAETWHIAHSPDAFGEQPASKAYPFLKSHFTSDQLAASAEVAPSGQVHSTLKGMPALEDLPGGVQPLVYDEYGDPIEGDEAYSPTSLEYPFDLWQPTAIGGNPFEVGVLPLNIRASQLESTYGTRGGFLAKYLLKPVVAREKQVNPAAKGTEAWGWLPPPLIGQGAKVQTSWLHDFLLNPYKIRPATVLRMPRFNMSPEEATKLVNYFAAVDNVDYPYDSSERQQDDYLSELNAAYQSSSGGSGDRFTDAMKIVTDNNYCVKCHLVGDFAPKGADRAKAPNLAAVYNRLRPDYLRKWIANPKTVLPYTSMPVNIPYDPDAEHLGGVKQDLYHGTSVEQVDALVDLLLNYDKYSKQQSSVAEQLTGVAPAKPTASVVASPIARPSQPAPMPAKPDPMPKPTTPAPAPAKPEPATPKPTTTEKKPLPASLKNLPKASGWGDLKVRFVYDGTAPAPKSVNANKDPEFCGKFGLTDEALVVNQTNGGIKNVVATLYRGRDTSAIPIHESYLERATDNVVLDNKDCRFEPHVVPLWTTQTLVIKNSDPIGHNTNYSTFANTPQNILIPAGGEIVQQLKLAERVPAKAVCSIHPWMTSWLVVQDNPYIGVSDKDGNLTLPKLPEGEWTIQFWQEQAGYVADIKIAGKKTEWKRGRVEVEIKDGEVVDLGVVQFAP